MPALDTLHQLSTSSLGVGLSDDHLKRLAELATTERFPAGRVIFKEASTADHLAVVCSGSVALDMHVPLRGNVRLLTLGSGDLLGWSAIVGDGIMTATATVLKDAQLLNIPGTTLRKACDDDPALGYAVMDLVARALAKRLQGTRLQMLDLFKEPRPAPGKLSGVVAHD
ncbi:cyclic nucleotide-binding domain-containing protein [Fuerstiella marisgermanici]|uniref:Transcriptional activator FtrB n=1 Tax=Fuerstiella marisgermanici TaxID=1891926 RepID=A0A1P8WCG7_9PLAN|nr:cyclic nucleotide-binding domain-containing protein [Fuerstiella marisgermanici]APZ91736.1 transcriptional activator FtrB [Fuerstiella marisgermanici]